MKEYLTPQIQLIYLEEDVVKTSMTEKEDGVFEDSKDDPWFFN